MSDGPTLVFTDHLRLDPALRDGFFAPGVPFAWADEEVLGSVVPVFTARPAHLRASLERAAANHGDRAALVDGATGAELTFAELAVRAGAVWRALAARGVRPGDRVAIAAANSVEHAVALWAVVVGGAVAVSLNGWWTPAELGDGVELTSPVLVLADERRAERLGDAGIGSPVLDLASVVVEGASSRPDESPALPDTPIAEDDPAVIMFTSGTTGRPRGATLSHRNLVHFGMVSLVGGAVVTFLGQSRPTTDQPAALCVSPLFHVSGATPLLANSPLLGQKLVFPPPGRWDPTTHLELTERHRLTSWSGVPAQLWQLLDHPDWGRYDTSTVNNVGIGGAPFSPELQARVLERLPGARLTNGYGMTETTGTGTWLTGERLRDHPGSVGAATPGQAIEIRDSDDPEAGPLPEGEVGEICVRGAGVFLGYWGDDEATDAALLADRWYRTGDFGRIDGDVLVLESRLRDLIIRGGENVYPLEIEHRLTAHPDIDDAAVIGVDHPVLGQEVKAVVVRRPSTGGGAGAGSGGDVLDAEAVRAWVGEVLAPFKVPAHVAFVDALPYTATGKVLKRDLA